MMMDDLPWTPTLGLSALYTEERTPEYLKFPPSEAGVSARLVLWFIHTGRGAGVGGQAGYTRIPRDNIK